MKGFDLYVCNNAYQLAPDAKLLYSVNYSWWQHYWDEVKDLPCEKWSTNKAVCEDFDVNWIDETYAEGLSTNPKILHHGHGSGYSLLGMAYHKGYRRILLLGYDCKYAPDYDGKQKKIGKSPRHFFGEYPPSMQHWPSVMVRKGIHVELRYLYGTIAKQGLVEVLNCTPGSAIDCFPRKRIDAVR